MMKALTIRQPWASLTLMLDENGKAFKQVETRSHRTNYRGRLAIHAGLAKEPFGVIAVTGSEAKSMKPLCDFEIGPDFAVVGLPYGAVIGEVTIRDCIPIDELWGTSLCTEREVAFGDWRKQRGRYGWILGDPVLYDQPIPARGQLGIWNWPGK